MREEFANIFTPMEFDAIGEILNISLGSSATAISNLLDKRVDITTPNVEILSYDEFEFRFLEPAIGVEITYTRGLEGNNVMLLKRSDVKTIVEILMGYEMPDEEFEFNEMNVSAICEVMNQMMGAASTAMADFLGEQVDISTPYAFEIDSSEEFKEKYFSIDSPMVVVRFDLKMENVVESEFLNLMPIDLAKVLVQNVGIMEDGSTNDSFSLDHAEPAPPAAEAVVTPPEAAPAAPPTPQPIPAAPQPPAAQPAAPAPIPPVTAAPPVMQVPPVSAEPRVIQAQSATAAKPEMLRLEELRQEVPSNLDMVMSIPMQISVEIGRTRKTLKEILDFNKGSLVVLDKLAGEAVDLYVNGQCVAKGNVVVVDDSFGVRITSIEKSSVTGNL